MATAGPNYASTADSDSTLSGNAWSNPGNAAASDNAYATASSNGTQYLKATGFGFSIPTGATIDGIVVEWERKTSSSGVTDKAVRIVKAGAVGSTDKSAAGDWPTTDTFKSYGGSTDLWGETWTAADINSANFGAAIATQSTLVRTNSVDSVRITVYYTPQIYLESAPSASSTAAADLTTAISLAGAPSTDSAATGNLTTGIALQGAATAAASASTYFSVVLDGAIQAQASASADLSTGIAPAGDVAGLATLSGNLTTQIPLAGNSASVAAASAGLSTQIALAGAIASVSSASATLTTSIRLAGSLAASAFASADLIIGRVIIPPSTQRIYLAEITCYDPTLPGIRTLRYSSGADGYDDAGTFYPPLIEQPATIRREIPADVAGGHVSTSYGALTLINARGALDALRDYYYDGYELTLKVGEASAAYGTFVTRLKATIDNASFERNRIAIRLRDRAETLKTPLQTHTYGGTNALPNGLDGTADDLKGKRKPLIFGRIAAMQPVLVNTSRLIYQVNDGPVDAIINVFDSGAYLTRLTDYTAGQQSTFETAAVAAGAFSTCAAAGLIKLGSKPFGTLAACVAERWDYTQISAAGVSQRILQMRGYGSADWVAQDFLDLDAVNCGSVGVQTEDDENVDSLIDRTLGSAGAWWGFDALNRFRLRRLDGPTGTSVATITDDHILEYDPVRSSQRALWQVTLQGDANYAVQDKANLAGIVEADRAAWWEKATRDQSSTSTAVKTIRLLSQDATFASVANGISQLQAEAARRRALFDGRRDTLGLTVAAPNDWMDRIDLGSEVTIVSAKCGYPAGRNMTVVMTQPDFQRNRLDLILWG